MGERIVVGMSGGVDSSVAALLLKEQGFDVIGVTMQIWQDEETAAMEAEGGCCGLNAVEDARRVCDVLGIPHYVMNFKDEFRRQVMDYFAESYRRGLTPNPCIACNRFVKWESLLQRALAIGADRIATGHYARIKTMPDGRLAIANSVTARKDQTYALYSLTQDQLGRTLLPVGEFEKEAIREMAGKAGLPVAHKPDSEDVCFIPDGDYAGFLRREYRLAPPSGNFVDEDGKILGRHRGIIHYTVGQRKGLGIAFGKPMYVKEIRPSDNSVVLSDNAGLFAEEVQADGVNWMALSEEGFAGMDPELRFTAKIRYNHAGAACRVRVKDGRLIVLFDEPCRAPAPGQALVVYLPTGEVALGGTIVRPEDYLPGVS